MTHTMLQVENTVDRFAMIALVTAALARQQEMAPEAEFARLIYQPRLVRAAEVAAPLSEVALVQDPPEFLVDEYQFESPLPTGGTVIMMAEPQALPRFEWEY